jgi:hypothetical protein
MLRRFKGRIRLPKKQEKTRLIDPKIILAVSPFVGYAVTYLYEIGFAKWFHIPHEFISLELTKIILATLVVFLVSLLYLARLIYAGKVGTKKLGAIENLSAFVTSLAILFIIIMLANRKVYKLFIFLKKSRPLFSLLFILALIGMTLLFKAIIERKNLLNKNINSEFKRKVTVVVLTILGLIFISLISGYFKAVLKEHYLVLETSPEIIVVNKYENSLVCSIWDSRKEKTISGRYFILEFSSLSRVRAYLKEVGPLSTSDSRSKREL